jgi:methyl-galactoside transport system substrate-binding protein
VEEDMFRWDQMYYVGADAKEAGVLQGEMIVDAYNKDKTSVDRNGDGTVAYVILEGESGHQDSLVRTEWSVQTLKNGGMKVEKLTGAIADWDRNQAKVFMEKWLKEYGDQIELIISNNDDMALGAIDAIEMLNMEQIATVGIDGIPQALSSLEEEKLLGTVVSDSKLHAQAIFDLAYALAKNLEVEDENLIQGKYIRVKQYKLTKEDNVK